MTPSIHKPSTEHIEALVQGMTPHVRNELSAMYPTFTVEQIVGEAFRRAWDADVIMVDGKVVCAMGITKDSALSSVARPWLIPTAAISQYKKTLVPFSKRWVQSMVKKHGTLENTGSATHERAIRWLKWLGFEMGPVFEHNGHKYVTYRIENV